MIFAWRLKRDDYIKEAITVCNKMMASHANLLKESLWKGLPEMTNKDGAECQDNCEVHVCSMATMLEASYDLDQLIKSTKQL